MEKFLDKTNLSFELIHVFCVQKLNKTKTKTMSKS